MSEESKEHMDEFKELIKKIQQEAILTDEQFRHIKNSFAEMEKEIPEELVLFHDNMKIFNTFYSAERAQNVFDMMKQILERMEQDFHLNEKTIIKSAGKGDAVKIKIPVEPTKEERKKYLESKFKLMDFMEKTAGELRWLDKSYYHSPEITNSLKAQMKIVENFSTNDNIFFIKGSNKPEDIEYNKALNKTTQKLKEISEEMRKIVNYDITASPIITLKDANSKENQHRL